MARNSLCEVGIRLRTFDSQGLVNPLTDQARI